MAQVSGRCRAVSYTHLDVYKRQGADLAEQLGEAVANIHGELTAYEVEDDLAAVSYTHLDVYKRQRQK